MDIGAIMHPTAHLQAVSERCKLPRSWCGRVEEGGGGADQGGGRGNVRVPHWPQCCPLARVPAQCPPAPAAWHWPAPLSSLLLLKVVDLIVHEARLKERQCDRGGKVEPSCSHEEPRSCSHTPSSLPSSSWGAACLLALLPPPSVEHWGEHGGLWGEQGGGMVATVSKLCDSWHPDISILKN